VGGKILLNQRKHNAAFPEKKQIADNRLHHAFKVERQENQTRQHSQEDREEDKEKQLKVEIQQRRRKQGIEKKAKDSEADAQEYNGEVEVSIVNG
jgi:adenylosuccinate lyase